jgi:hypothetical protein
VDFKLHQEYIAKVLCVNKDKTQMGCNGKCHLSKQMQKVEEKEQKQTPQHVKGKRDFVFYSNSTEKSKNLIGNSKDKKQFICTKQHYEEPFLNKVFHPPQFG